MKNLLFATTKYSIGKITASVGPAWLGRSTVYARVFLGEMVRWVNGRVCFRKQKREVATCINII